MNFLELIWLIPLLPAAGALLMLLVGSKLPKTLVSLICPGLVGAAFAFSRGAARQLAAGPEHRY